jgi:hypothetical protein
MRNAFFDHEPLRICIHIRKFVGATKVVGLYNHRITYTFDFSLDILGFLCALLVSAIWPNEFEGSTILSRALLLILFEASLDVRHLKLKSQKLLTTFELDRKQCCCFSEARRS